MENVFLLELLRRTAEHYLKDMVQLVFMRLPQFPEDTRIGSMKHLKMKHGAMEPTRVKRKSKSSFKRTSKDYGTKNKLTGSIVVFFVGVVFITWF